MLGFLCRYSIQNQIPGESGKPVESTWVRPCRNHGWYWVMAGVMTGLLLTFASCSEKITDSEKIDVRNVKIIDSKILIEMWEVLDPDLRTLEFRCATEKIYGCCNWLLVYHQLHNAPDRICIEFVEIFIPWICLTMLGPATADINLGRFWPNTYPLFIVVNGDSLHAELKVTEGAYTVLGGEGKWITFPRAELRRVPPKTIWGQARGTLVQAYMDTLFTLGAEEVTLVPGDYGYFSIDNNGTIVLWGEDSPSWRTYLYAFDGDWGRLESVIRYFGVVYGDSMRVEVYGSEGQYLASWVLASEP